MASPVSVLDLTVKQVADIEDSIGVPVNRWQSDAPSMALLYAKVLSASTGEPESSFLEMTMRDLISRVSLDESDEEEGEEDPNP